MNAQDYLNALMPTHLTLADLPHRARIVRAEPVTVRNRFVAATQPRLAVILDSGRSLICERLVLRDLIAALGEDTNGWAGALLAVECGSYNGRPAKAVRVVSQSPESESETEHSFQYKRQYPEPEPDTESETESGTGADDREPYPSNWDEV